MTRKQLEILKRKYLREGYKMGLKEAKDRFGEEWADGDVDKETLDTIRECARRLEVYSNGLKSSVAKYGEGYDKKSLINYAKGIEDAYNKLSDALQTIEGI